jgi:hypothetical protein
VNGRADTRARFLRRVGAAAVVLALLALIFLASGHWIIGLILALGAAAAVWAFLQARSVR